MKKLTNAQKAYMRDLWSVITKHNKNRKNMALSERERNSASLQFYDYKHSLDLFLMSILTTQADIRKAQDIIFACLMNECNANQLFARFEMTHSYIVKDMITY